MAEKQVYRGDRRNAARKAKTLRNWRDRPRIKTALYGVRTYRDASGETVAYKVHTYVVGA